MLKAILTADDGTKTMLLGLSDENIARLVRGEPIFFNGAELGYAGSILIMHGETNASMEAEVRQRVARAREDQADGAL